jgi:ribose transport system substrate-binding protein
VVRSARKHAFLQFFGGWRRRAGAAPVLLLLQVVGPNAPATRGVVPPTSQIVGITLHQIKNQPWSQQVVEDLRSALAGSSGIELRFFDAEEDAGKQRSFLEELLTAKPSALIILPIDAPALRSTLRRYRAAGVPVIVLDNDVGAPDAQDVFIVADNVQFGRSIGEFFVEAMGGHGEVVEIAGMRNTQAARDRSAGFREAIASTSVRIVGSVEGKWLADAARAEFGRVLDRCPRLDGVFAHNDEMACGAWDAAVSVGREDELLITGIDALRGNRGLQMLIQGRLAATVMNPSPGPAAAEALLALLRHEPFMAQTIRRTALLRSNERIRCWQARRSAKGKAA